MTLGLSRKELDQIVHVLTKFPDVHEAVLFGSRAMGNFKPASDVDVALKGPMTSQTTVRIKSLLEEESSLPYLFDVVDYRTIENPDFKDHIDRRGMTFYKR